MECRIVSYISVHFPFSMENGNNGMYTDQSTIFILVYKTVYPKGV